MSVRGWNHNAGQQEEGGFWGASGLVFWISVRVNGVSKYDQGESLLPCVIAIQGSVAGGGGQSDLSRCGKEPLGSSARSPLKACVERPRLWARDRVRIAAASLLCAGQTKRERGFAASNSAEALADGEFYTYNRSR